MSARSTNETEYYVNGVAICAPEGVVTDVIRDALTDGGYEATEARIASRALKPGDRVLEIGSGLGYVSSVIGRDPRCAALVCVEADPRMADIARQTLSRNGVDHAIVINGLFGESPGRFVDFYQRRDFWMSSMVKTEVPAERVISVPVLSLSEAVAEHRVTCIVCDIEGAEVDILPAADLASVDRLIVELHDHVTGMSGVGDFFARMQAKGFVYDPRCSYGTVVLFRKLDPATDRRPYGAV